MRLYLIGGWPVVEQFPLYMSQNLLKTRFARHPGEHGAPLADAQHSGRTQPRRLLAALGRGPQREPGRDPGAGVPAELHALSHWCWHTCASDSLAVAMAATNYAIEGVTGEWSALVCSNGVYENAFPKEGRKRAMKWLKLHAQYDDAHRGRRWRSSAPWPAPIPAPSCAGNCATRSARATTTCTCSRALHAAGGGARASSRSARVALRTAESRHVPPGFRWSSGTRMIFSQVPSFTARYCSTPCSSGTSRSPSGSCRRPWACRRRRSLRGLPP